jgi:hypothetical protein
MWWMGVIVRQRGGDHQPDRLGQPHDAAAAGEDATRIDLVAA